MKYIRNEDFLRELKICFETDTKTEEIGRMFLMLATRYAERGSFSGYTWKDDMICESVVTCLKYMHNFDVTVEDPNPFSYFSRIIHNSFLSYISKQKKHSKIKDICYKNVDILEDTERSDSEVAFFSVCGLDYQKIVGETKKKKKKKKKKK